LNNTVIWFVCGLGLVVAELFSGTFYLLMVAIGFAAGGLTSYGGGDLVLQLVVGAAVGVAGTLILRRTRWGRQAAPGASEANPDMMIDIGQPVHVSSWHNGTARVNYRGAQWDAVPEGDASGAVPGNFKIVAIRGSTLVLAPVQTPV